MDVHQRHFRTLLLLPSLIPLNLAAQNLEVVPDAPTCGKCVVLLDSVLVLDGRSNPHVGEPIAFAVMEDGRILMTPGFDMAVLVVFDRAGRFLRTLGREGEGPGEFKGIGQIKVGAGDTIRVYDHWNPRVTIFSPELEYLGSRRMQVPVGAGTNGLLELADGRLVTQRSIPLDAHAGYPVHLLDSNGRILRSFGAENPKYDRAQQRLMWRTIAPASKDRVWVAPTTRYAIELWNLSGEKIGELTRDVPWFRPHPKKPMSIDYENPEARPHPGIIGLRRDQDGLLWALIRVPDREWKDGLGRVQGMHGPMVGIARRDRYSDTVVEVLDPQCGCLVTARRFDPALDMLTDRGFVVSYREDENGFPFLHIWRLRLELPEGG